MPLLTLDPIEESPEEEWKKATKKRKKKKKKKKRRHPDERIDTELEDGEDRGNFDYGERNSGGRDTRAVLAIEPEGATTELWAPTLA